MIEQLITSSARLSDALTAKTNETITNSMLSLAAGGLVSMCLSMWICIKGMTRPIHRMKRSMEALAANDLTVEVPGTACRDDIGSMARAVEVFKVNGLAVEQLKAEQVLNEQRNKKQRQADMLGMANQFEAAIGEIVHTVSTAATELANAAGVLTTTAERTGTLSIDVASAADTASGNVQSVASASEQLAASVHEISRQVQDAATITGQAVTQADDTNQRIQQLLEDAAKVDCVVELINTIAGRTKLLALNATIEAARAGASGSGFAVVAAEVKSLAEQTAAATIEISAQIRRIQDATSHSVTAIQGIGGTVGRISEISSAVAAAVEQQLAATHEIARNVQLASNGTLQVATHIGHVREGSADTGAASAQVLSSATRLSLDSDRLRDQVHRFLHTVRSSDMAAA